MKILNLGILFLMTGFCAAAVASEQKIPPAVKKVQQIIDMLEKEDARKSDQMSVAQKDGTPKSKKTAGPRMVKVSDDDINTYIAHRIAITPDSLITALTVNADEKENHLSGSFDLDFKGLNMVLRQQPGIHVDFKGRAESRAGKGRFLFDRLMLGGQPVTLEFLDNMLKLMASMNGVPYEGLNAWYELPYGIERLETTRGQAKIYF